MNQIATLSNSPQSLTRPGPLPEKVDTWLSAATNRLESRSLKFFIPAECAPDAEQREYLERREAVLARLCARATADDIEIAIGHMSLALAFPASDTPLEADARLAVYSDALAGKVSVWALQAASRAFIDGSEGDGRWLPKPGELRIVADRLVTPLRAERARILKVLHAIVLPAIDKPMADRASGVIDGSPREMSATTKASLQAFRDEVAISKAAEAGGEVPEKIPTKEDAIAWLADLEANPIAPPKLSESAKQRM